MKRFLLGIVTLSLLAMPSYSFSSDSVYGIYTDNVSIRQNQVKRDEAFDIKQFMETVQSKLIKADTTTINTLMNMMKEISNPQIYQALKTQTDLVKCDTNLSETEQNTKIYGLINDHISQIMLSNYHNPATDKAEVYRELAIVKKNVEVYSNLNEKMLDTDSIVSSISDVNKRDKIKSELKKLSDVLNNRIIDVSALVTQLEECLN